MLVRQGAVMAVQLDHAGPQEVDVRCAGRRHELGVLDEAAVRTLHRYVEMFLLTQQLMSCWSQQSSLTLSPTDMAGLVLTHTDTWGTSCRLMQPPHGMTQA